MFGLIAEFSHSQPHLFLIVPSPTPTLSPPRLDYPLLPHSSCTPSPIQRWDGAIPQNALPVKALSTCQDPAGRLPLPLGLPRSPAVHSSFDPLPHTLFPTVHDLYLLHSI